MDNINNYVRKDVTLEEWIEALKNGSKGVQSGNEDYVYISTINNEGKYGLFRRRVGRTSTNKQSIISKRTADSGMNIDSFFRDRVGNERHFKYWILLPITINTIIKELL